MREQYNRHWKDYYQVLQVHPKAELEIINAAFRMLAKRYHPDTAKEAISVHRMVDIMVEINEAREVLTDPKRRARYDEQYRIKSGEKKLSPESGSTISRSGEGASYGSGYTEGWRARTGAVISRFWSRYILNVRVLGLLVTEALYGVGELFFSDPEESQRVLPWPGWRPQRASLFSGIPIGVVILIAGIQTHVGLVATGTALVAGTIYAGIFTRCLRTSNRASRPTIIIAGACVSSSGAVLAVGTAIAVVVYAVLALTFISSYSSVTSVFRMAKGRA